MHCLQVAALFGAVTAALTSTSWCITDVDAASADHACYSMQLCLGMLSIERVPVRQAERGHVEAVECTDGNMTAVGGGYEGPEVIRSTTYRCV